MIINVLKNTEQNQKDGKEIINYILIKWHWERVIIVHSLFVSVSCNITLYILLLFFVSADFYKQLIFSSLCCCRCSQMTLSFNGKLV